MDGRFQKPTGSVEEGAFLLTLIAEMMVPCKLMNHIRTDDPYGGYSETWAEGASFQAAVIKNNTTEAILAEKQGVTETFTIVTNKPFRLEYHDIFKRVEDGQLFRVTGNTVDSEAPKRSTVPISKVTAEKWEIPEGGIQVSAG